MPAKNLQSEEATREFGRLVMCFLAVLITIIFVVSIAYAGMVFDLMPEPVAHVMLESVAQPLAYAALPFLGGVAAPGVIRAAKARFPAPQ